jgi:antitoxin (DNA-binding transcriptional repressor) of toxin-antitoxin stability system
MKLINVREARAGFAELLEQAQGETVVILRHGKPVATLQGTRGADLETVLASGDPEFWREIERRRKEPSRPLAEIESELAGPKPVRRRRPARTASGAPAAKGPRSGRRSAARRRLRDSVS